MSCRRSHPLQKSHHPHNHDHHHCHHDHKSQQDHHRHHQDHDHHDDQQHQDYDQQDHHLQVGLFTLPVQLERLLEVACEVAYVPPTLRMRMLMMGGNLLLSYDDNIEDGYDDCCIDLAHPRRMIRLCMFYNFCYLVLIF